MPDRDYIGASVLIVEDNLLLADEMAVSLRNHGLPAAIAPDWDQAERAIEANQPDIIVLDQRLGAVDAVRRLPRLRELTKVPVLVLTANQAEADRILALEIGADDFLVKPISGRELVARLRAQLRRASDPAYQATDRLPERPRWRFSAIERRLSRPDGTPVPLTSAEFDLLATLVESPSQPVDRDTLTQRVLGRPWRSEERAIDNLVLNLRRKIGTGGNRCIVTIRNQGYAFTTFPAP